METAKRNDYESSMTGFRRSTRVRFLAITFSCCTLLMYLKSSTHHSSRNASRRSTVGCKWTDSRWTPTKSSLFGSEHASSWQRSAPMRSNCSWTRYRSPHLCQTWAWSSTIGSRWQIMLRISVDPVPFNCARYVRSGGRWHQMPEKRWWMRSSWVDWTTAIPWVTASMKVCWTSCSISRIRLLDLSRTHGNTIISLMFLEICIGFQFVKESFSNWIRMVYKCQHGLCPSYLAEDCILLSATRGRQHLRSAGRLELLVPRTRTVDIWPMGFRGGRPGGLEFSAPCSKRTESLVFLTVSGGDWKLFCSDSCN